MMPRFRVAEPHGAVQHERIGLRNPVRIRMPRCRAAEPGNGVQQ